MGSRMVQELLEDLRKEPTEVCQEPRELPLKQRDTRSRTLRLVVGRYEKSLEGVLDRRRLLLHRHHEPQVVVPQKVV